MSASPLPAVSPDESPDGDAQYMAEVEAMAPDAVLAVRRLSKFFPVKRGFLGRTVGHVRAVDEVSFALKPRETLGLVGESGCGKTTAGRAILQLVRPTGGSVHLNGSPDLTKLSNPGTAPPPPAHADDLPGPYSSLNPRMTVGSIIGEALTIHRLATGRAKVERVAQLLEEVGLTPSALKRFPHEFSGGQRQRIGIARALAVEPQVIIADEPVSALDVSIQSQVINLLERLQQEHGLSFVFVAHDLSVVGHISHRVAVMYLGRIVEIGPKLPLFEAPRHPYTQALLAAVPKPDPERAGTRAILAGDVPSPVNPPKGCAFHPRCPHRFAPCDKVLPRLAPQGPEHYVACHLYDPAYNAKAPVAEAKLAPAGVNG